VGSRSVNDLEGRIFWEGYGLDRPMSGIFVHAERLASQLVPLGCIPTVIGGFSTRELLPEVDLMELEPLGPLEIISGLKPVHPMRAVHRLRRHLERSKETRPVILHGLSNVNLPLLNPLPRQIRMVLTVHDLIPLLAPEGISTAYRIQFQTMLPRVLDLAHTVVCVSEWTKSTILDRWPKVAPKLQVIRNAFFNKTVGEVSTVRPPAGDSVAVLCVSRHERYKRLDTLLRMARAARGALRVTLVTNSGGAQWAKVAGEDLLSTGVLSIRESVPTVALQKLYLEHDVYVQTSQYEGFCLPAAEALVAGIPVVYQGGSGIDEVVGSSVGIKMEHGASEGAWVEACKAANALRSRSEFRDLLNRQLHSLGSWKDSATALKNLYTSILKQ
jgi:glycosyltransferase involved in cell wall biosynthesis